MKGKPLKSNHRGYSSTNSKELFRYRSLKIAGGKENRFYKLLSKLLWTQERSEKM